MTKDELKNRISMALKDPILQQGFEIICREFADLEQRLEQTEKDLADYQFNYPTIKELEKENAELKADNDARKFAMAMSEKVEKQLREQIEKMKCCGNCKHCKYSESEESYEWCEKHDQIVNIAIKPCYAYEMFDLDKAIKEIEK